MSYCASERETVPSYTIDNVVLERVRVFKDVGVVFNEKLNFDDHVASVVSMANKTLGFIKKSTSGFGSAQAIFYLFRSLVMPILTCNSQIWSPCLGYRINQLEAVQRRFLRYL